MGEKKTSYILEFQVYSLYSLQLVDYDEVIVATGILFYFLSSLEIFFADYQAILDM